MTTISLCYPIGQNVYIVESCVIGQLISNKLGSMGIVLRQYLDSSSVVTCRQCRTHLTEPDEVISKEFQGQHGRAYLYATVYVNYSGLTCRINVVEGEPAAKTMTTGQHIKATEPSQKYKVGHYILERALISEMEQTDAVRL